MEIDTKSIIIEELEKELDIAKNNISKFNNQIDEYKKQVDEEANQKIKEAREYYEKIIDDLYNEKNEIEQKLQAIEYSRSYKITQKIKRILGGKNE